MFAFTLQKSFASISVMLFLIFALALPQFASAQALRDDLSTSEIRSLFNDLLDRVLELQSQARSNSALDVGVSDSVDDSVRVVETIVPVGNDTGIICPFTWTRTLHVGDTGSDVKRLQQFLNSDPDTRIAGAFGGPGSETEYFGVATADAVARFQEKYSSSILAPVGLSQGSGYFGNATRQYINRLCAGSEGSNSTNGLSVEKTNGSLTVTAKFTTSEACTIYTIEWGDGTGTDFTPVGGMNCPQVESDREAKHTYSSPGTYTVTLRIGSRTETARVTVSNSASDDGRNDIKLSASVTGARVVLNVTMHVQPSQQSPGQNNLSIVGSCGLTNAGTIAWGDGTTDSITALGCRSGTQSFSLPHTYSRAGTYTIRVTNQSGNTASERVTVQSNTSILGAPQAGSDVSSGSSSSSGGSSTNTNCLLAIGGCDTDNTSGNGTNNTSRSSLLDSLYNALQAIGGSSSSGSSSSGSGGSTSSGSGSLNAIGGGTSSSGSSSGGSSSSSSGSGQNCLAAIGC